MFKSTMNLLSNLKIGQRLTLGFGVLVALILVFGIIEFVLAKVQDATAQVALEAEEEAAVALNLSLQLAEARQSEKDFLIRWRIEGFDAAYNSYYLLNQTHLQTLRDLIAEHQLEGHEHNRAQLTQIEEAVTTYDTLFTSVVLSYQKRGFKDTGLEGEFRIAVQALETSTVFQTNPELLITLLQMRRHEKDYFLRGEQQYIDSTRSADAVLQNQIRALDLPEVAESELLALAAAYLSKFDEVVALEAEINTQTGEYLAAIGAIEQIPDELVADALEERNVSLANLQAVQQFAQIVNFSVLGLAVVIGLWLAIVIRRSITEPLGELTSAATKLGQGDLSQRAAVRTRDEAGALAQAFNQMAKGIQEAQRRVEARTQDLATTIEVGRLATSIYSQEELLPRVVEFIRSRFSLYYTQLYLVDEAQRYATLNTATGEVGQRLLQHQHRLDLGQTSLVGTAVKTRQSILVTDTETSSIHKKNPLLPDTRSELAIPLTVGDDILGVLDMQAEKPGTFNQENLPVYEAMASQLAAVMQGAKTYDAAQAATETAESIIRRLTGDQWAPYLGQLAQGKRVGYQYDLETPSSLEVEALFQNGERVLQQAVMVRGQQIGSIVLEDNSKPEWTAEEKALVEGVAERVALTLEQFRAFDETRTTLQSLDRIYTMSVDLIGSANFEGYFVKLNPAWEAVMGYSIDELMAEPFISFIHPDDVDKTNAEAAKIADGVTTISFENRYRCKDGSYKWISWNASPDMENQQIHFVARDVTEEKRVEEERQILYQAARKLTDAHTADDLLASVVDYAKQRGLDSATLMYIDLDEHEQPEWAEIIAQWYLTDDIAVPQVGSRYYLPQFPFAEFWMANPDHPTLVEDILNNDHMDEMTRAVMQQTGIRAIALLPLYKQGRWVGLMSLSSHEPYPFSEQDERILTSLANQATSQAEALRALVTTEKRAAELETVAMVSAATTSILNVEELLQSVVDLTNDSFNLYHTHIYLLDDANENLVLAAGAGEPGRLMKERGHSIPINREHSLVARAARTLQPVISNDVTAEPDFLPNPLLPETKSEVAISMIVAGEVIGVLDVQADVTNRFKEEDVRIKTTLADQVAVAVQNARTFAETQAHAERLREVDRLKSQFLANMSHELRTPLNSIIGYSEVLLDGVDGDLTEDAAEDVQAIHDSGKHLLSIINEILDLAKIEAGQMQLDRKPVKLTDFIQEIVKAGQILVKDKPVVLNWMEDSPIEAGVMADAIRLRQIMWNLVSNAVKFTEDGSVTVAYGMYNEQEVYLKVKDTGIGISEDGLSVIFQRFRQADGSSTRRAGGTGLGLTITRELVQMHGGEIHVESEVGVGSTFWFTLPVKQTETAQS